MKLLIVLSLGCLLLHQTAAQCARTIILMDSPLPTNCPTVASGCALCNYQLLNTGSYAALNTITPALNMNDIVVLVPSSTTNPNAAAVAADIANLKTLAAATNLYLMTNSIPVGDTNANNLAIMNVGTTVPNAHVVDYYMYLNTITPPTPANANPYAFLKSTPPTLSGKCGYPVTPKVVILTDDAAPYPLIATSCLGSCFYYTTSKYLTLSTLGLGQNDALVLMTTLTSATTTVDVINYSAYITNLALNTNVYYFTSPGASNAANNYVVMAMSAFYPRVHVKDYATYGCPLETRNPSPSTGNTVGNCACKYIALGFGALKP